MGASLSSQAALQEDDTINPGVRFTQGLLEQLQGKQPRAQEQAGGGVSSRGMGMGMGPVGGVPPALLPQGLARAQQQGLMHRPADVDMGVSELIRQDDEIRRALESSRKLGEMLVKSGETEAVNISKAAQELIKQEYIAPAREVPCQTEERACLDCYRGNKSDPTQCAAAVQEYHACATRAFSEFAARVGQPAAAG